MRAFGVRPIPLVDLAFAVLGSFSNALCPGFPSGVRVEEIGSGRAALVCWGTLLTVALLSFGASSVRLRSVRFVVPCVCSPGTVSRGC